MTLQINLTQSDFELRLLKNGKVIDPVKSDKVGAKQFDGVDFERAIYYHDLSDLLTPLEVDVIHKKGWIKKDNTVIYHELLTGLISTLDNLLKRNRVDPVRHIRYNKLRRGQKAMSNGVDIKVLKSYKILSSLGQDSTSRKIVTAFVEGLKTFKK